MQIAANLLDGSGDGVWFIELAPLASGDYIPSTIAHALGITLPPEGDQIEQLTRALKEKRALLVFDNCEHMVEPAARVISAILRTCPSVKILASSRQGLGIAGEATYRMPSLNVPRDADRATLTAAESTHYAAISLFVERAQAGDQRFGLTDDNAPIVADICRRLDGIPLAIELAASRVKMFSPQQINERLNERFRMLTGGSRDVLPRQQTLRALIDWSHDLLDERERVVFRRLGIFVNGFTYAGAVAVAGGEDLDEFEIFDVLASLVDKSLVLAEPQADAVRYRLLESTRAYASERSEVAGERDLLAARHLSYLRNRFAELWSTQERTARQTDIVEAFAAELEDVRYALDGALARSALIEGAELLSFAKQWVDLGLDAEAVRRCEQYIVALPPNESLLLSRLSTTRAFYHGTRGQRADALKVATEAVAHARASEDANQLASALRCLGAASMRVSRLDEAEEALSEAEAIASKSRYLRFMLLTDRALLSDYRGDFGTAIRANEQIAKEQRSLGNIRGETTARLNIAECEYALGHTHRAIAVINEIIPAILARTDKRQLFTALANLAGYLITIDDIPGTIAAAREVIIHVASEQDYFYIGIGIEHLALAYALRGDLARAAKQEGFATASLHRGSIERENTEKATYTRLMTLLGNGLAPDELARLLAEGAALPTEAAIALALEDAP